MTKEERKKIISARQQKARQNDKLKHKPTNAVFNVTDDCNNCCVYCFTEQNPHYMTLDTAKSAVDYLANNIQEQNETEGRITFFGGEPLLCWDSIIVPVVNYAEQTYPKMFTFSITTNGILLTYERLLWMKKHNIYPHFSMDGAKQTQDMNRPCKDGNSSFEKLQYIIPAMVNLFPEVTFRATITPQSACFLYDNFIYALQMGFSNCFFTPNVRENWTAENKMILFAQLGMIYEFYNKVFSDNKKPFIDFIQISDAIKENIQCEKKIFYNRSAHHCGMGEDCVGIGYDGSIYGCQEQATHGKRSKFYLGNIETGYKKARHINLINRFINSSSIVTCETPSLCIDCPRKEICKNKSCPSTNIDLFSNLYTHANMDCSWKLMNFYLARNLIENMKDSNSDSFVKYFNSIIERRL